MREKIFQKPWMAILWGVVMVGVVWAATGPWMGSMPWMMGREGWMRIRMSAGLDGKDAYTRMGISSGESKGADLPLGVPCLLLARR